MRWIERLEEELGKVPGLIKSESSVLMKEIARRNSRTGDDPFKFDKDNFMKQMEEGTLFDAELSQ